MALADDLVQLESLAPKLAAERVPALVRRLLDGALADRELAMRKLIAWCQTADSLAGARFAIAGGALVESGVAPTGLGRALIEPIERALVASARFFAAVAVLPSAEEEDATTGDGLYIGQNFYTREALQPIVLADVAAFEAYQSLDIWYRPAVAAWTRDAAVLREAQARSVLGAAAKTMALASTGAGWLTRILRVCLNEPFVVTIPELDETWELSMSGCADVAQLRILLSDALGPSLERLGSTGAAPPALLASARGDGPLTVAARYACDFAIYPWQAIDPETRLPENGRYRWEAPGGAGDTWLPSDFLPGDLVPLDERRVIALVGPKRDVPLQSIESGRVFVSLPASLHKVRRLDSAAGARWNERIAHALRLEKN